MKKIFVLMALLLGISYNVSFAQQIYQDSHHHILFYEDKDLKNIHEQLLERQMAYKHKAGEIKKKLNQILDKMRTYHDYHSGLVVEKMPDNDLVETYKVLKAENDFVQQKLSHVQIKILRLQESFDLDHKLLVNNSSY